MSWTGDILVAIAELLAGPSGFADEFGEVFVGAGVGTWRPNGAYQPDDDTPIFIGDMPPSPHRVLVLSAYPVDDDPSLSDSVLGVQLRTRGAPEDSEAPDDLDDAAFDVLHGARGIAAGTGRIVQVLRRSGATLGRDDSRRYERSSNYYVTAHRPSPNRL